MFVKSTAVLALLSVAAQVAVAAQPPACVIAAVNTESDPSDFKTICSSEKALSYLSDNCGDHLKTAQDYFADICKTNGEEVTFPDDKDDDDKDSTSTESSSPTATRSGSGSSASETGGSGSSTTYGSNANNPSATNSGSTAESTGAASSVRLGMDVLGMSALLAFGAMLAI